VKIGEFEGNGPAGRDFSGEVAGEVDDVPRPGAVTAGTPGGTVAVVAVVVGVGDAALGVAAESDLLRAFRTADFVLIHAADCRSTYSSWTCCGVRY
jgi:hypothetical protein